MTDIQIALPKDFNKTDFERPSYKSKDQEMYDLRFELWEVPTLNTWVIPTLEISKSKRGFAARTYAIGLNGKKYRVGKGPHVKRQLTVYVRESRVAKLQKYLDLKNQGAESAHNVRDRISSRRLQGQVMRAEGRTSWRWDV